MVKVGKAEVRIRLEEGPKAGDVLKRPWKQVLLAVSIFASVFSRARGSSIAPHFLDLFSAVIVASLLLSVLKASFADGPLYSGILSREAAGWSSSSTDLDVLTPCSGPALNSVDALRSGLAAVLADRQTD